MKNDTYYKLIEKSKEAFIIAIELYNKPTIKYRVEGFSIFICNAWELMLKAHMIDIYGDASIYYKDNPSRTLSLENCISKIFTNKHAPINLNLEKISELRNTSTHFITEEYEMIYVPLFQSCVFNYVEKMQEFHDIDITESISQNFLTLSVKVSPFDESKLRMKYTKELADKLIKSANVIQELSSSNNDTFSIQLEHLLYQTKNKSEADFFFQIDQNASEKAAIIRELKDPNKTHRYRAKKCVARIEALLKNRGFDIKFNMNKFLLFVDYYGLKYNEKFCYISTVGSKPQYQYSYTTIEFIVEEYTKDPVNIIQNLKDKLKKKK